MNGAELKTLREALELPVSWCSGYFNVAERSWRFWESDKGNIPNEIITSLQNLLSLMEITITESVNKVLDSKVKHHTLCRFRTDNDLWAVLPDMKRFKLPVTFHARILFMVKRELNKYGIQCDIVYDLNKF